MPELVSFDGGLNKSVHPQYVQPNQATECLNCDISRGIIEPFREPLAVDAILYKSFYYFNDLFVSSPQDRSYVEYNNKLYYSDGAQAMYTSDGVTFKSLGVDAPTGVPLINVLTGTFTVAVTLGGAISANTSQQYRILEDDTYMYSQNVVIPTNGSTITFSFGLAKAYKLYRLDGSIFKLVGTVTGPGSIIDGAIVAPSIGVVSQLPTPPKKLGMLGAYSHPSAQFSGAIISYLYQQGLEVNKISYSGSSWTTTPLNIGNVLRSALSTSGATQSATFFTVSGIDYVLIVISSQSTTDTHDWVIYKTGDATPFVKVSVGWYSKTPEHPMFFNNAMYSYNPTKGQLRKFVGGAAFPYVAAPQFSYPDYVTKIYFVSDTTYYVRVSQYNGSPYKLYKATVGSASKVLVNLNVLAPPSYSGITPYSSSSSTVDILRGNNHVDGNNIIFIESSSVLIYNFVTGTSARYPFVVPNGGIVDGGLALVNTVITQRHWSYDSTNKRIIFSYSIVNLGDRPINSYAGPVYSISMDLGLSSDLGAPLNFKALTGTYSYRFTVSDGGTLNESAPSDITSNVTPSNGHIVLNDLDLLSNPGAKPKLRIYRIGGSLSQFSLVEEIPFPIGPNFDYIDTIVDSAVAGNGVLTTVGTFAAPDDILYLTEHRGRLWGAVGQSNNYTRLHYSDIGTVDVWGPLQYLQFNKPIVAVGSTANGLVVFTDYETHVVLGNDVSTFAIRPISKSQGCSGHLSVQGKDGHLIYTSHDGICVCNGAVVDVISVKDLGLFDRTPTFSAIHKEAYYVGSVEDILVFDYSKSPKYYNLSTKNVQGLGAFNGVLYSSDDSTQYIFNGLERTELSEPIKYVTGDLTEAKISNLKEYDEALIRFLGVMTLSILLDGVVVVTQQLSSGATVLTETVGIPNDNNKGYAISFEMSGIFSLFSIYYSVQGRTNE